MLRQIVFLLVASVMITACSEQPPRFNHFDEGQQALSNINNLLSNQSSSDSVTSWPFSNEYLQARHLNYQGLKSIALDESQQAQLNYLIIAERYPERYFVWPEQRDVVSRAINKKDYSAQKLAKWLELVQTQLMQAEESSLKLNKIELKLLHSMVQNHLTNNDDEVVHSALSKLEQYLSQYTPRSKLGLVGLANGKDWYQSKLNYFGAKTQPPLTWLSNIQSQLKQIAIHNVAFHLPTSHSTPLVMQFFSQDENVAGLDWQLEYRDPLQSKRELSAGEQYFWLVMMETDLGIHYHTWSEQQARVNLIKRLGVTKQEADWLIEDIILYPATSFIFSS
ncbi:hypothetical protein [Pseudoalteromonas sp. Ps84H-4]|uniref:hypothetical protein n=1 Tax=Pseudoalteromonas sp. Ps84H-4 TaxID=2954502 RepID=UPI0020970FEA|nr:hypothetical protein [Pseudoalteromonas sp. Ps84H-4]MCO7250539.1 hypothetical protein [Pseudoalteromonas sp. Ps84H-4]